MSQISQKAANEFKKLCFDGDKLKDLERKQVVDIANALILKYGQASGTLSCEMYEKIAAAQGTVVDPAEMAELPEYGEVAKAINGSWKQGADLMIGVVQRLTKQVGADTTLKNAIRDKAQYAWIPSGDTCAYCLMLASKGWQPASANTAGNGHAEHIHAHCDCQYAVRFDKKSNVAGYRPEKYLEMFEKAEGDTLEEKINSLRRALNQHKGTKVNITSQAIDKVRLIDIKGISRENNILVQKTHKELLKFAKEENDSNEVASLVELQRNKKIPFVKGNRHEVNIYSDSKMYHLLRTAEKQSLVLCHNHPGNTDFSANDISIFMRHDTIKAMTIVTNKGKVKIISKNNKFQVIQASELMKRCMKMNNYNIEKSIEEFLKKCYSVGIDRQ